MRTSRVLVGASLHLSLAATLSAAQVGTAFTYQGQLKQSDVPYNGSANFQFALFDSKTGGTPIGALFDASNVQLVNGLFTVDLDFGAGAFTSDARWLQVTVNGTPLSPRQPVTPTPAALSVAGLPFTPGTPEAVDRQQTILSSLLSTVNVGAWQSFTPTGTGVFTFVEFRGAGSNCALNITLRDGLGTAGSVLGSGTAIRGSGEFLFVRLDRQPLLVAEHTYTFDFAGSSSGCLVRVTNDQAPGSQGMSFSGPRNWYFRQFSRGLPTVEAFSVAPWAASPSGVSSMQRVGIGTAAPGARLDVRGAGDVNVFAGDLAPFGAAGFETNFNPGATHAWFAENGDRVFSVTSGGAGFFLGNVGIGTTDLGFSLAVNGSAGKPGGGTWSTLSDRRLKKEIEPLRGALARLLSLRGVTFEFTEEGLKTGLATPGRQIGLIAQDVEPVFPEWVSRTPSGHRFVNEQGTTALFVEGLRELRAEKDAQIAAKDAEIAELHARLSRLEKVFEASYGRNGS